MKSDYRIRAQKFIKQIFPYIDGCMYDDLDETIERVQRFANEKRRKILVNNGVSRVAIITADYVIKWDRHLAQSKYERNQAGDCEKEYLTWRWLQDENPGYTYLFAEIFKFDYQGYTFYVMPRVYNIRNRDVYVQSYCTAEERAFLNEYFHDLHDENYGFKNGRPVIFDYAWHYIE